MLILISINTTMLHSQAVQDSIIDYQNPPDIYEEDNDNEEVDYSAYMNIDTALSHSKTVITDEKLKKYSGTDYEYDIKVTTDWSSRFKAWLNELIANLFKISDQNKISNIVEIIIYFIYFILIVGAIWIIIKAVINKEGRWIFRSKDNVMDREDEVLKNEEINDDLNVLITNAENNKNYREAIRYYFVWVIKNLHKRKIVNYSKEKTTQEYYYEIKEKSLKHSYKEIQRIYNAVWYGEYVINAQEYAKASSLFKKIIKDSE